MPLPTCPDCAAEVSDAASACPRCGRPADGLPPRSVEEEEDARPAVRPASAEADAFPAEGACPACGSREVRRVRRVVEEGTAEVSLSGLASPTPGVLPSEPPRWAAGRGIRPSGTGRTLLASRLLPPPKPGIVRPIVEWFGLAFVLQLLLTLAVEQTPAVRAGLMLVALGLPFLLPFLWHRRRKSAWRAERAEWERSWLCLRCGAAFVPGG